MLKLNVPLCSFFLCLFTFASCVDSKKSAYFTDQKTAVLPSSIVIPENVIQNNDLLSISVSSLNAEVSAIFNSPNNTPVNISSNYGSLGNSAGYLVNVEGNIYFPIVGAIKASGLTENQLRKNIVKILTDRKLLVDPIVSIRHLNFKVTVLGEVRNPTVITVPNEKITLLEAVGMAGDITIYGKKDNIMVIREDSGRRSIQRLNLNSTELFSSPYYYLRANDIVYVEANKARVASSTWVSQSLPIIISILSFAAIILDRAIK